jgi:hypothetical protein
MHEASPSLGRRRSSFVDSRVEPCAPALAENRRAPRRSSDASNCFQNLSISAAPAASAAALDAQDFGAQAPLLLAYCF